MNQKEQFSAIDTILNNWLQKYGLHVYKRDQEGEDCRVISIVDNQGTIYNLSIYPIDDFKFQIKLDWNDGEKVWRLRNKKAWEKETDKINFEQTMNAAYKIVESWIKELGHQRTWQ